LKKESPRTLKLIGKVSELPLFILIDSKASHNFISRRLVEDMGWSRGDHQEYANIDGRWAQVRNAWSVS